MALHERTVPGVRVGLAGIAVIVLVAGCTGYGTPAPGGGAPGASAPPPAATATAAATSTSGGGYGGRGYGSQETPGPSAAPSEAAGGEHAVAVANAAGIGPFLTGENGKTLYVFRQDSPNTSACSGGCATAWPPFVVGEGESVVAGAGISGTFGTIAREDGTTQVTYNGAPLYYYAADAKAGDTNGQGVGGVWFVAAP